MMHADRHAQSRRSKSERKPTNSDVLWKHPSNEVKTPDEVLDIAIKEWGFSRDFQPPLIPPRTVNASITNIEGEEIATGYDRVIAYGGSIWIMNTEGKTKAQ